MKRIIVVGGGISGLAAAQAASALAPETPGGLEVIVIEKGREAGGKALTLQRDGWIVEAGPTGYLDNEPEFDRIVEAAGIAKVPANAAAAHRFLVRGGRLREVHANPLRFARSGLLGPLGMLRILREPFIKPQVDADESIWGFARRRLGAQAADRLIAPMVLGVFAGDAKQLSLPAAFPRLRTLEREHGSLIKGMIAKKRAGRLQGGPSGPPGVLTSFEGGLQSLPRALAARGTFDLRCGQTVQSVEPNSAGGWRVALENGEALPADAVVLAGEPWAMASILGDTARGVATELDAITCPPVCVVALGFDEAAYAKVPKGFGALIPRGEGYRILGCLWDTHLFPGRSPEGRLLVRTMLGGSVDPEAGTLSEEELALTSRKDLARLLGLDDTPVFQEVVRWPRAIPQYELGHLDRVARIAQALTSLPGLFIAGNALEGIAFSKAGVHGLHSGEAAARYVARPSSQSRDATAS